ncbi:FxLD family lanthipeptide [Kitasatospora sp. NPDC001527]|uniref:FxLD family lanthipeptide n=1 Tax=Kitasatospora sp. NPDC001527 TaxID=3154519 RepID=UPI00331DF2DC
MTALLAGCTAVEDDLFDLDIKVIVAAHPSGKLMCATNDGCGSTCATGSSACGSSIQDPS